MIGKIILGKSFRGCLSYCLNDKQETGEDVMKNRAAIICSNKCSDDHKTLIQEFNAVRRLNPKLEKPVWHITLSLAPGEHLPKDKLREMCEHCAEDLGFSQNQFVAILHKDTDHQHIHIVANRIGFDKKTVSDSNNYRKMAAYCRKMELQFGLTQVLSPRQFLNPKDQQLPRQDLRKDQLKNDIQQTLLQVSSYHQFEEKMKSLGYQVLKARGISFIDSKKVKIKGSEVGFPLMKIEKILALKKELSVQETVQEMREKSIQQQLGKERLHRPLTLTQRLMLHLEQNRSNEFSTTDFLKIEISKLIGELIKPIDQPDYINPALLKEARKKKRRRRRL